MDRVGPSLYVGGSESATDEAALRATDIETVVSLTHDTPAVPIESITHRSIPLIDGPQHDPAEFQRAVETTVDALDAGERVLVHCSVGASRSPAVAGTALALVDELGLEEAFRQLTEKRPAVQPHESLLRRAGYVYTELSNEE
jgi:protein-tyrosine phosphatase